MNGIHDMGGMDGFGPVDPVETGPVFHAAWEGGVMAISRVMAATPFPRPVRRATST